MHWAERFSSWLNRKARKRNPSAIILHYYAVPTPKYLVVFKIFVSRDMQNLTTCLNGRKPNSVFQWSNLNWRLFQILRFSEPSLPGMTSSQLQLYFLSGGFIITMVIVVSFAHEHKTAPNDDTPELLTRIVQSPTTPNDTIQLTKKD